MCRRQHLWPVDSEAKELTTWFGFAAAAVAASLVAGLVHGASEFAGKQTKLGARQQKGEHTQSH